MVHLHNGILPSREKGAYTLQDTSEIVMSKESNITRDIEVKNNLTMGRGEWGGDSEERGLQELL